MKYDLSYSTLKVIYDLTISTSELYYHFESDKAFIKHVLLNKLEIKLLIEYFNENVIPDIKLEMRNIKRGMPHVTSTLYESKSFLVKHIKILNELKNHYKHLKRIPKKVLLSKLTNEQKEYLKNSDNKEYFYNCEYI